MCRTRDSPFGPVSSAWYLVMPLMAKADVNRRIPMAGSRFNPLPGERVSTGASPGLHSADDPQAALIAPR